MRPGIEPRLENLAPKKLVGMRLEMSRINNKTSDLWRGFSPRKEEVSNRTTSDSISMQVYAHSAEQILDANEIFEKWAAVEVQKYDTIPEGMYSYSVRGGLYAVFTHHGSATDLRTFNYIYGEWLPDSHYVLDHREHFEVLPDDYDPFDADSKGEIWIPVKLPN
jgi:AraC family transcriptional regulator